MTTKTYQCGCGEWMGEACEWRGPLSEMVVVEYMPESLRESHTAARNSGVYPHNGAVRVAVQRECAERLMEYEGDSGWATITTLNPADHVEQEDTEEYTFDLVRGDTREVVTVDAASYEDAAKAITDIRDRDFPGHAIEDHMG